MYKNGYTFNLYETDTTTGYLKSVGKLLYIMNDKEVSIKIPDLFFPVVIMQDVDSDLFNRIKNELIVDKPSIDKKVWGTTNENGWSVYIGKFVNESGKVFNDITLYFRKIFRRQIVFDRVILEGDEKLRHLDKIILEKEK